ncbi:hypothetical protein [Rosistilla oblonga]|uniref:Uncharacterized protein n=1 Tax=Rosistilla oblonga TaxID=2527990 RepID=A0A518J1P6_9BACT|nr:hypothetical protein [Rosistilla oblonga]QDV59267.1 hypothetical protein Mal33_52950 [Rosistilla oblonga]
MLNKFKSFELVAGALTLVSLAAIGCASRGGFLGVDCCADIPAGAIPEPAGAKLCDWQTAQVTSAVADQTVFYQSDFIGTSATLSPAAIDRMARNANSGLVFSQPSIVEPSGNDLRDAARVESVIAQLASLGVAAPVVEVATPAALGMQGQLAERVGGGFGNPIAGTGAPISQASGFGGQSVGMNVTGGMFQ